MSGIDSQALVCAEQNERLSKRTLRATPLRRETTASFRRHWRRRRLRARHRLTLLRPVLCSRPPRSGFPARARPQLWRPTAAGTWVACRAPPADADLRRRGRPRHLLLTSRLLAPLAGQSRSISRAFPQSCPGAERYRQLGSSPLSRRCQRRVPGSADPVPPAAAARHGTSRACPARRASGRAGARSPARTLRRAASPARAQPPPSTSRLRLRARWWCRRCRQATAAGTAASLAGLWSRAGKKRPWPRAAPKATVAWRAPGWRARLLPQGVSQRA